MRGVVSVVLFTRGIVSVGRIPVTSVAVGRNFIVAVLPLILGGDDSV
jgi:hypothetical protein